MFLVDAGLGGCWTWWMLDLVDAVICVNSRSLHGDIERNDVSSNSAMMVELSMRKREQ